MLQPVFDFIDKLSTDFSWKKVVVLAALLTIAIFFLFAYETQTNTSQLSKYERSIAILEKLESIKLESTEAKNIKKNLYHGLSKINNSESSTFNMPGIELGISYELEQSLYTAAPLLLLSFLFLIEGKGGSSRVLGGIFLAFLMGGIGYTATSIINTSNNANYIPLTLNVILFTIMAWFSKLKKKKALASANDSKVTQG